MDANERQSKMGALDFIRVHWRPFAVISFRCGFAALGPFAVAILCQKMLSRKILAPRSDFHRLQCREVLCGTTTCTMSFLRASTPLAGLMMEETGTTYGHCTSTGCTISFLRGDLRLSLERLYVAGQKRALAR